MSWIEMVELFIILWPHIRKILDKIANAEERNEMANKVTTVWGSFCKGEIKAENPKQLVDALWSPLPKAAA